jgi:hypothetical protein
MLGTLLEIACEMLTGHRMGPWVRFVVPESDYARFERSRCRWCRQGFVRPMRLEQADWWKELQEHLEEQERARTPPDGWDAYLRSVGLR